MAKDIGTVFENDTQAVLEKLKNLGLLSYVRLYDTKSARGKFLPAQPGDFIIAKGAAHLLECKASEKYASLSDPGCLMANVKPSQAAEHRLWARAGSPCWFIFYSLPALQIELWKGEEIGLAYAKKLKLGRPEMVVSVNGLGLLLLAMIDKGKEVTSNV